MIRLLGPLALLFLGGCGVHPPTVGGEYPKRFYVRIVSLSPSTTELLAMLNSEGLMVGRTAACDTPLTIRNVPIVANDRPDIERIIQYQADLVVADANLMNPADMKKIKEQGIAVKLLEVNSVQDWIDNVWALANTLMQQQMASRKVDEVNEAIGRAKSDPIEPKLRVLVAMGGARPWVAGVDSFQADVVRQAGGEPVGPAGKKFGQVGPEQVLKWNPDVVFISDDPAGYTGPAWKDTNAGKNGRIVEVNPNLLLRPGARVADLINGIGDELRRSGSKREAVG